MATRSETVSVKADVSNFVRGMAVASGAAKAFNSSLDRFSLASSRAFGQAGDDQKSFLQSLDTSNDRMSFLVQTTLALTPALVPIGAVAVPALTMLTSALVSAAGAGVAAGFAFQGIGDGLDAINKYQLDPTEANLDNLREKLSELGPAAREFTVFLNELGPQIDKLQDVAGEAMFPGLTTGLEDVMSQMPVFTRIIDQFAEGFGQLAAEAGQALTGPFWDDFFDFIAGDATTDLVTFGRTMGNFTEGLAAMFQAFDPLSDSFSEGLLGMSRSFNEWAQGLSESQGFREFVDYIRTSAPQLREAFSAIVDAVVSLAVAFSSFSGEALQVVETIADVISAIASSPAGPSLLALAAALSAVSRAMALFEVLQGSAILGKFVSLGKSADVAAGGAHKAAAGFTALGGAGAVAAGGAHKASSAMGTLKANAGLAAAGVGALALSFTDLDDKAGLANTAMFAVLGSIAGPGGAAVGAFAGLMVDAAAANDKFSDSMAAVEQSMELDPLNFDAQLSGLEEMQTQLDALRSTMSEPIVDPFHLDVSNIQNFTDNAAKLKNAIEGIFGSSDVEEAEANYARLTGSVQASMQSLSDIGNVVRGNTGDWVDYTNNLSELEKIGTAIQPALDAVGLSLDQVTGSDVVSKLNAALVVAAFNAMGEGATSTEGKVMSVAQAMAAVSDPVEVAAGAVDDLTASLSALFGTLDEEAAMDTLAETTRNLSKELKDSTDGFEGNSAAAAHNREVTRAWAADVEAAMVATAQARAGQADLGARLAQIVNENRNAFIAEARAAGISRDEIQDRLRVMNLTPKSVRTYFEEIGLDYAAAQVQLLNKRYRELPERVRTDIDANGVPATATVESLMRKYEGLSRYEAITILKANAATADATVRSLMNKYESLSRYEAETIVKAMDKASPVISRILGLLSQVQSKTVTVTTVYGQIGRPPSSTALAEGGTLDFYGRGGTRERHVAQIAPAGAMRVWAEPETMGEAYIPFAPSKRARSLDIFSEVGRRLGVAGYAGGGVNAKGEKEKDTDPGLEANEIARALAPILKAFGKRSPITEAIEAWLAGVKEADYSAAERAERVAKALDKNTSNALKAFRVGDRSTKEDVKSEVQELLTVMRELLGKDSPVVARMTAMGDQLIAEARERDKLRESIQDLRDTNRELVSAQRDYAQTVAGSLTNDPFQGSLHDFDVQTSADTNDAKKVLRALRIAKKHGLDGPLFRELAASGNVALILEFAQLSRKGIERREDLFESQRAAAKAVGKFAGDEVFGEQIAENSKELRQATRELHRLNKRIDNLEAAVERGSEKGTRKGSRDGTRDGHRDGAKGRHLTSKSAGVWIGRNPPR